ncbi:glycosyl hydrolase family 28-related protein [Streptomyces cucumeris]|uniref:glycosyl hydrolase family 28-related protein n=1 Tax=Streptomyces cucumeris TaxID=2962890 RepID=UPI003EB6A8F7
MRPSLLGLATAVVASTTITAALLPLAFAAEPSAATPTPKPRLIDTRFPTGDHVVADFDVADYDADATGKRDSTAAIQSALDDCYKAGGGTVWLPAGRYRVTDTLKVRAYCTLRGDHRDPEQGEGDYGTVVLADLASGDSGPSLFRIGGSAGVVGMTVFYPRQNAEKPVPYGYTFEIPGRAVGGEENYMMSTVEDVTMLNSYRGIGVSDTPNDKGVKPKYGQVHETATIRDVKGTALSKGVVAYNGADVGTWENVDFDPKYWAQAGSAYNAPPKATIEKWTRANGTAFTFGDLEWEQFYKLKAAHYKTGIDIVKGQRIEFAGVFLQTTITDTDTAVRVGRSDERWGAGFANSTLKGSQYAVDNSGGGYVKLTGTTTSGDVKGDVPVLKEEPPVYKPVTEPKVSRAKLYDVAADPYNAPHGFGTLPTEDATPAVQKALDDAGAAGGGIVYLPAGWYRINSHLKVPANVELRGSSSVPNRDQIGNSHGTVLLGYDGRNTSTPDTDTALITLAGDSAGTRGLRVFYPENNPFKDEGMVPYPYAVRAKADRNYVVNMGATNPWNGLDFTDSDADNFFIRKVDGVFLNHGISVGANEGGRIEGVLSNGNSAFRLDYGISGWLGEDGAVFPLVIDKYTRKRETLVDVNGAQDLSMLNVFGYGPHDGLRVRSGSASAFNLGTDNLGEGGHTVEATSGQALAVNTMRYAGATSTGNVKLYGVMAINMVQHAIQVSASPDSGGTAKVIGNLTEPHTYEEGSKVTLVAKPASGYRFTGWTEKGSVVSTDAEYQLTVDAAHTLTATFEKTG